MSGGSARPGRVPVPAADEDHRTGLFGEGPDGGRPALHERLDGARPPGRRRAAAPRGRLRPPAGPGRRAADSRSRSSAIVGRPPRASAVQPSDRPDAPARSRTYTSVRPAARPRASDLRLVDLDRDRRRQQRLDDRVRAVVAEQVRGDAVGHAQRPREQRPVGVLHEQQPVRRRAARAGRGARAIGAPSAAAVRAAQLERQADARAPPRDVVVEIAVEPLEARVEVRGERDQQQLDVHRLERERPREVAQPEVAPSASAAVRARLERRAERGRRRVRPPAAPAAPAGRRAARPPARRRCTGRGSGRRGRGRPPAAGRRRPARAPRAATGARAGARATGRRAAARAGARGVASSAGSRPVRALAGAVDHGARRTPAPRTRSRTPTVLGARVARHDLLGQRLQLRSALRRAPRPAGAARRAPPVDDDPDGRALERPAARAGAAVDRRSAR